MKKKKSPLLVYVVSAALAFSAGSALAGDGKEVTVSGEAQCAKCAMDETDKCQTAIEVTKDGQKVVYYLENNDVAKAFHKNVCTSNVQATATGTVEMKDGKHVMTASKIEKQG
jgi:hypothetical protein